MVIYPNLARLNTALQKARLGIPEFRSRVDPSGRNLQWLKKVVPQKPSCTPEIIELLNMEQKELLHSKQEESQ
jgi:hypothetical protein